MIMRMTGWMVVLAVALTCVSAVANAAPCAAPSDCRRMLNFSDGSSLPYYRTHSISAPDVNIQRAIVVIHGAQRTAEGYMNDVEEAAVITGVETSTLVAAPYFQFFEEASGDELCWPDDSDVAVSKQWGAGGDSYCFTGLSSFAVVDHILDRLNDKSHFPNLRQIVLVGFSGGGQFVNRYAALGLYSSSVPVRYIVSSPSSYMYLNDLRLVTGTSATWRSALTWPLGSWPSACHADFGQVATANDYRYGLDHRSGYPARTTATAAINRYLSRSLYYVVGGDDVGNDELDVSCHAMFEGSNRVERAQTFKAFMDRFFVQHQTLTVVPGIAHEPHKMFLSTEMRLLMFW
jgi:hypothetical protein